VRVQEVIRPLIAGNWKMHKTIPEAVKLATRIRESAAACPDRDVAIAPSFTALRPTAEVLRGSNVRLCAQNVHPAPQGAFTGEVSAPMLADAGCQYVIVGHSERRTLFGETDELVRAKIQASLQSSLMPIFCVGESLAEREDGRTFDVLERQLKGGLNNFQAADIRHLVVAYEPVWAIGTGKTATPDQAQEVHVFIRRMMSRTFGTDLGDSLTILYGGSVNPKNIDILMACEDINGVLVGGASLEAESFGRIVGFQKL